VTKENREMAKGRGDDQVMGGGTPGETEGDRRPTGVSPGEIGVGSLGQGQRWTAARKREVVLRLFRGEPLDLVSRELGVELYRLEQWREDALAGMEEALKARNGDPLKAELDTAMQRIGELTMENELLWVRVRRPGPLAKRRSKK
jgi:transposase